MGAGLVVGKEELMLNPHTKSPNKTCAASCVTVAQFAFSSVALGNHIVGQTTI